MRILILNWRCPMNPRAGGAEVVTYEIARRLVESGHSVEWFSSAFPGSRAAEDLNGISIARAGHQWTVHLHAMRRYWRRLRDRFDVVIDEVNTVPFFTPLWADVPTLMFIHQLAREVWWHESVWPISLVGYLIEPWYLRAYRKVPVITVSPSTAEDLRHLGFAGPITVVPEAIDPIGQVDVPKDRIATFLYVGRLAPSKRVHEVITAFCLFRRRSTGKLWIVGDGTQAYREQLHMLTARLRLTNDVGFLGRISNDQKHRLMARAHAVVLASVREGWGLVVTEANACGTTAVSYDVPGLRDSIKHMATGLLVSPTPEALAEGMYSVATDSKLRESLSTSARLWSATFNYDRTLCAVNTAIEQVASSHPLDRKSSATALGE